MKKIYVLLLAFMMHSAWGQGDGSLIPEFSPPSNVFNDFYAMETVGEHNGDYIVVKNDISGFLEDIIRINSDGTVDDSFELENFTNPSVSWTVQMVYIEPDGSILIAGRFTNYGTSGKKALIRVSSDGILDQNFNAQVPNDFYFTSIAEYGNRIYIGGCNNNSTILPLYSLDKTSGSQITSYNITGSSSEWVKGVFAIKPLSGGDIIIGGSFTSVNGSPRNKIAKINANGTLNSAVLSGFDSYTVYALETQIINGVEKILVGGSMTHNSGRKSLLRLETNLTIDNSFTDPDLSNPTTGERTVYSIAVQESNKIVIGGNFSQSGTTPRSRIARLNADGTLDECFDPGTGLDYPPPTPPSSNTNQYLYQVLVGPDQNILITGVFTHYDGTPKTGVAKVVGNAPLTNNVLANPDTLSIISGSASATVDILENDTYYSGDATTLNVTVTEAVGNPIVTGINFNASAGTITVASNTAPGNYTYGYTICPKNGCGSCSSTNVSITVTPAVASIVTTADTYTVTGCGEFVLSPSVLDNDKYNGQLFNASTKPLVTVAWHSGYNKIQISSSGIVTVLADAVAGVHTVGYKVTEIANPSNFTLGSITVTIIGVVDAVADSGTVTSGTGGVAVNVFTNDTFDCRPVLQTGVNPVSIQYVTSTNPYININSAGDINVPGTVTPGTYQVTYQICDTSNFSNCDTATATIIVLGTIIANNDTFLTTCLNGVTGSSGGDVTLNDTMNGITINDNLINISVIDNGGLSGLTINSTGIISVPANSPLGTYVITYKICQKNTENCVTATAQICLNNGLNPGTGANNTVHAVLLQPNGYIIIGGAFTTYNGVQRNRIARLKPDLSLDLSFDPQGIGFNNVVHSLAFQGTSILVGGRFTATGNNQYLKKNLARVTNSGLIDNSFTNNNFQYVGTNPSGISYVQAIALDNNGRILVGGNFGNVNSFSGTLKAYITRLSASGAPDNTFKSVLLTDSGVVNAIEILSDQTIVIGGQYLRLQSGPVITYKVTPSAGMLEPNFILGKCYPSANNPFITSMYVMDIEQKNGKLLIAGDFNSYNHLGQSNLVQISTAGATDVYPTFSSGLSSNSAINAIAVDPTYNKIIIGGDFTSYDNNPASRIARLTSTGGFDSSFITGTGFPGNYTDIRVWCLKMQSAPDNRVIVGGHFTSFNGNTANFITRLVQTTSPVTQGRINQHMDDEAIASSISIYPNPSEGLFNIDFKGYDEQKFDITIHNALGQLIYQGVVTPENTNQIDLTRFESGSYFITLLNTKETINKIVIKK